MKDKDIVALVKKRFDKGIDHKDDWRTNAIKNTNYYEHHQWPKDASDKEIHITINRIHPHIDTMVALLMQGTPEVELQGRGPEDQEMAEVHRAVFNYTADKDRVKHLTRQAVEEMLKTGLGVWKERFDPDLNDGEGDVIVERIDAIDEIILDPKARRFLPNYDGEWIIHAKRMNTEELKNLFPDQAKKLGPDNDLQKNIASADSEYQTDYGQYRDQTEARTTVDVDGEKEEESTIKEMWYKEHEVGTRVFFNGEFLEDFDEKDIPKDEKDQYDVLRRVKTTIRIALVVGDTLLSDEESPYAHKKFPFVFFPDTQRHSTPYPHGIVYYLRNKQNMINKFNSLAMDNAIRTHNTGWMGEEGALSKQQQEALKTIGSAPGAYTEYKRGYKFGKVDPAPFPQGFLTLSQQVSMGFDEVSSVSAVQRGDMPYETSGRGIEALKQTADVAQDSRRERIEAALTLWAELRFSNCQQFLTNEQMLRISTEAEKYAFMPINQEITATEAETLAATAGVPIGENPIKTSRGILRRTPEDEPRYILNDLSFGKFDVKFVIGPNKDRDRRTEAEIMTALYDRMPGMAMFEQILEKMDIPNRAKLIERIQQENQALQLGTEIIEDPNMMNMIEQYKQRRQQLEEQQGQPGGGQPGPATPSVAEPGGEMM